MRPAALIFNPKSGRQLASRLLPQLLDILKAGGFEVEPRPTSGPGDATVLARSAAESDAKEVVFALGGDGTLREVAAGLIGTQAALGPLPAGTANVLTIALKIPRKPIPAAKAFAHNKIRTMDVGLAGKEPFLMMVSGGLDAVVMSQQNPELKRRFGAAAIAFSGISHWWRYTYPEIELRLDGETQRVTFFSASNIRQYGGAFRLAPEADYADGLLDVVLFRGRGRWAVPSFVVDLLLGRHTRRPDLEIRRVDKLKIVGPLPGGLQMDGDVVPVELPLSLGVSRAALRVLAPQH